MDLALEAFSTLARTPAAPSSEPTNELRSQDLHASAEPHDVRRQRRGVAPKEAAALDGLVIIAVLQGRLQPARLLRAVRQLQADLGKLVQGTSSS